MSSRVAIVAVTVLVLLAGCSGLTGENGDDVEFDDTDVENGADEFRTALEAEGVIEIYERTTETLDPDETEDFRAAITGSDSEDPSDSGIALLERLDTIEDRNDEYRNEVAVSAANDGTVDETTITALDRVLDSPESFQEDVFEHGTADVDGTIVVTGELAALGIDPNDPDEQLLTLVETASEGGFTDTEIVYLGRASDLAENDHTWAQAIGLDLINEDDVAAGITDDDVAPLADTAGDGLLDGTAATLDLDSQKEHPEIVALVEPLADGGYSETDLEYLHNAAEIADDEALWTQAESIGLLEDTVADGRASEAEARELRDSTGDGLLNGKARSIGLDPAQEHPEVGEVATTLTEGEYGALERDYLDRVADISEYQNNEYEVWSQAEQLGLLDDAVADGQVSDEEYWAISNDASNRLLNGMEDEFGTDPDRADTAGDGYEDHLKWGPLRDLGFEVSPDEPDVIVEVDATTRTDLPSSSQLGEISDLMATEPDERVNVHFERCDASVDPIYRNDDHSTAEEHKRLRGIGAHHVVMIDGSIHDFGGGAYWNRNGHSWAWIDGTMSSDQKAQTIAHELGHLFGLAPRDFAGIDSQEYDATEYDSVMNYNIDRDLTFSTGSPFDDYEGMADEKYGSWHQSTDELETMWEDGSVNDIAC